MRRCVLISLACALSLVPAAAREARWDDQLKEMNYLMIHISTINAVNGMNLSIDQATELRRLAWHLKRAGAAKPKATRKYHPDLRDVKDTYYELEEVLLSQEDISKSLEKRVADARVRQSAVIAESIRSRSRGGGSCTSCHARPAPKGNSRRSKRTGKTNTPVFDSGDYSERDIFLAHLEGLYTRRGIAELRRLAPKVDAVLTDGQKDIIQNFACCLIPPQDLSDPVRAGEVAVSDKTIQVLRFCRSCPETRWTDIKGRLVALVIKGRKARSPGVTDAELKATRRSTEELLETVRTMPDTEFEMKKEELCARFKPAAKKPDEKHRRFMAAFFLLAPGSDEIYTEAIKRARREKNTARKRERKKKHGD